jgi:hypothetical protein
LTNDLPESKSKVYNEDKQKGDNLKDIIEKQNNLGLINDSDSIESNVDHRGFEINRGLIENATYDQEEQFENTSNKSD